jgi:TolA-binding protein
VELLLTEDEMKKLTDIVEKEGIEDVQKQEQIVEFLEKIIPDLEDIMLEKALKLKSDMVEERVVSLESMYSQDEKKSGLIKDVKKKMEENKWADVVDLLNEIDNG